MVLVQGAHHRSPEGQLACLRQVPPGQVSQRGLVQDRLRCGRQPAALREQPRLEGRGVLDRQAVEQVAPEAGQGDGLPPVSVEQDLDVDRRAFGQRELHRVAVEQAARTEAPADLGQAPAQRAHRVVRLREEEGRQLAPRRGPFAQQQQCEERPALPAPVTVPAGTVHRQAGPTQELDVQS